MKRAIIIGNGFDLALGAKTSFRDFIESTQYTRISSDNSLKKYYTELKRDDENWCDLEGSLKGWIGWFDGNSYIGQSEIKKAAKANARRDFVEMQQAIQSFVREQIPNRFHHKIVGMEKLVKAWHFNSDVIVYNFNYSQLYQEYTSSVATLYPFKLNCRHFHMHGTLEERNAVFGTTESDLTTDFKFAAKVVVTEDSPSIDYLLQNSNEIEIFGHSLGSSDWNYFRHLFGRIIEMGNDAPKIRIYTKVKENGVALRENISNMRPELLSELRNTGRAPRFFYIEELFASRYEKLHGLIETDFPGVPL